MKGSVLTTRTWMLLIGALLLVIAAALNFAQRVNHLPPPTDGIAWTETTAGVIAASVAPDSAAARARLAAGDRLIGISLDDKRYDQIVSTGDIQIYLEEAGVGGAVHYRIDRPSNPESARFYIADLYDLRAIPNLAARDLYINFIGLIYLFVGLFVLLKQVTQKLPSFGLPVRFKALVDARNLFDMGVMSDDADAGVLVSAMRRSLRGGIAVRF